VAVVAAVVAAAVAFVVATAWVAAVVDVWSGVTSRRVQSSHPTIAATTAPSHPARFIAVIIAMISPSRYRLFRH
jgi:hypothetical protein